MRSIVELLEVLRDNIRFMNLGLCGLVRALTLDEFLSFSEYEELLGYIESRRPTYKYDPCECSFSELASKKALKTVDRKSLIEGIIAGKWGWLPGEVEPRLRWLNERIEIEKTK